MFPPRPIPPLHEAVTLDQPLGGSTLPEMFPLSTVGPTHSPGFHWTGGVQGQKGRDKGCGDPHKVPCKEEVVQTVLARIHLVHFALHGQLFIF